VTNRAARKDTKMKSSALEHFDVSSRRKRRMVMAFVIGILTRMKSAEETIIDNIPPNLKGGESADCADLSIDRILDAIDILMDAY